MAASSTCWDANQDGDYRCYARDYENGPVKELPDGVYCARDDGMCTSGFCRDQGGNFWTCATPLPEGAECNPDEETSDDRCADGFGCMENATSSLGGTCRKYKLPGEPCDPKLTNAAATRCRLHNEAFICEPRTDGEPFCIQTDFDCVAPSSCGERRRNHKRPPHPGGLCLFVARAFEGPHVNRPTNESG